MLMNFINLGAKKILVDLAKELEKFKDITAENKYRRTKSFVNYLKKHFPPKRGVLPKFPETKDKTGFFQWVPILCSESEL